MLCITSSLQLHHLWAHFVLSIPLHPRTVDWTLWTGSSSAPTHLILFIHLGYNPCRVSVGYLSAALGGCYKPVTHLLGWVHQPPHTHVIGIKLHMACTWIQCQHELPLCCTWWLLQTKLCTYWAESSTFPHNYVFMTPGAYI